MLERIVVALALRTFEARGFRNRPAYLVERASQPILGTSIGCDSGELLDVVDDPIDLAIAIERDALPRRIEVAPLAQGIRSRARDRTRPFSLNCVATPQQPAHSRPGLFQRFFEPSLECAFKKSGRDIFRRDLESGIDARLDRALAEQIGAERMDGADARLFEFRQRVEKIVALRIAERFLVVARALDFLAQSQLQLARSLFGKGHRDDGGQSRAPRRDHRDDAVDQLGGFSGAGRRLDDQRGIEVVPDAIAHALVGRRHGLPRKFHSGARRCASLLLVATPFGAVPPALMRIRCSS